MNIFYLLYMGQRERKKYRGNDKNYDSGLRRKDSESMYFMLSFAQDSLWFVWLDL